MKVERSVSWKSFVMILLTGLFTSLPSLAEKAQSAALWIMPNEFVANGDPFADKSFAEAGNTFLKSFRKRDPGCVVRVLEGKEATRDNIVSTIRDQLEGMNYKKGKPCVFTLYYGGHGTRSTKRPLSSTYLVMQGGEVGDGKKDYRKLMMLSEVLAIQQEYEHVNFQAFIDCCYSADPFIDSDAIFRSDYFSNRGFIMTSSAHDQQAFGGEGKSFTNALAEVMDAEAFNAISTPAALHEAVKKSTKLPSGQQISIFPRKAEGMSWPLAARYLLVLEFGIKLREKSVSVDLLYPDGTTEKADISTGIRGTSIGMINIPVKKQKSLKFRVTIGSDVFPENGGHYEVKLEGQNIQHKNIRQDLGKLAKEGADYWSANWQPDADALMAQLSDFGLTREEQTGMATRIIAAAGATQNATAVNPIIAWSTRTANELGDPEFSKMISVFDGSQAATFDKQGFKTLERLKGAGLGFSPAVSKGFQDQLFGNLVLLAGGQEDPQKISAAWIPMDQILKHPDELNEIIKSPAFTSNPKWREQLRMMSFPQSAPPGGRQRFFEFRELDPNGPRIPKEGSPPGE